MNKKLKTLDSLEILNFDNHQAEYPTHYHETYCISLIHQGIFGENKLLIPQGSILISHPYEIHDNKLVEDIGVSFSTFYVSQDVINFLSPLAHTTFEDKIIEDPFIWNQLNNLAKSITNPKQQKNYEKDFYTPFSQAIALMTRTYGQNQPYYQKESPQSLDEVKQYITKHLNTKIDLSALAALVGMSKYQFIRWFKTHVGITPFEYILLKRVGYGKRLIQEGAPLVDVSLASGFYDQSHFSNYFKKYIGMSPNAYRHSCNIFQDF